MPHRARERREGGAGAHTRCVWLPTPAVASWLCDRPRDGMTHGGRDRDPLALFLPTLLTLLPAPAFFPPRRLSCAFPDRLAGLKTMPLLGAWLENKQFPTKEVTCALLFFLHQGGRTPPPEANSEPSARRLWRPSLTFAPTLSSPCPSSLPVSL